MPSVAIGVGMFAAGTLGSAVLTGAVYGALIGGVTTAIKGGNVLKGALVGGLTGAIGGAVVGVASGLPTSIAPINPSYGVLAPASSAAVATTPQIGVGGDTWGNGKVGAMLAQPTVNVAAQPAVQGGFGSFLKGLSKEGQQELIKQGGAAVTGLFSDDMSEGEAALKVAEMNNAAKRATPVANAVPVLSSTAAKDIVATSKVDPAVSAQTFIDWSKEAYKTKGAA